MLHFPISSTVPLDCPLKLSPSVLFRSPHLLLLAAGLLGLAPALVHPMSCREHGVQRAVAVCSSLQPCLLVPAEAGARCGCRAWPGTQLARAGRRDRHRLPGASPARCRGAPLLAPPLYL